MEFAITRRRHRVTGHLHAVRQHERVLETQSRGAGELDGRAREKGEVSGIDPSRDGGFDQFAEFGRSHARLKRLKGHLLGGARLPGIQ